MPNEGKFYPNLNEAECMTGIVQMPVSHKEKAFKFHNFIKSSNRFNWSLLSWIALKGLIRVLEFGAIKYAPHDWEKGLSYTENLNSLMNHVSEIQAGRDWDIDPNCSGCQEKNCASHSGLRHADHLLCRAMFLSHFFHTSTGTDDRNISK